MEYERGHKEGWEEGLKEGYTRYYNSRNKNKGRKRAANRKQDAPLPGGHPHLLRPLPAAVRLSAGFVGVWSVVFSRLADGDRPLAKPRSGCYNLACESFGIRSAGT